MTPYGMVRTQDRATREGQTKKRDVVKRRRKRKLIRKQRQKTRRQKR